jgi:hypothetical protein
LTDFKIGTDFFNLNSVGFDEIGNRGGSVQGSNNIGGLVESATNVHNLNQYFTLNASKKFSDFTLSGSLGNEFNNNYRFDSRVRGLNLVIPGFANLSNAVTYAPASEVINTKIFGVFADVVLEYKNSCR